MMGKTDVGLGKPVTLDLRVEFYQELGAALGPGTAAAGVLEKEVNAKIGILNEGVVGDGETADPRKDKVLEGLDADSSRTGVDKKDVGGLESGLAVGCPEAELAVVFPLLLRGPMEDGGCLREDVGHGGLCGLAG